MRRPGVIAASRRRINVDTSIQLTNITPSNGVISGTSSNIYTKTSGTQAYDTTANRSTTMTGGFKMRVMSTRYGSAGDYWRVGAVNSSDSGAVGFAAFLLGVLLVDGTTIQVIYGDVTLARDIPISAGQEIELRHSSSGAAGNWTLLIGGIQQASSASTGTLSGMTSSTAHRFSSTIYTGDLGFGLLGFELLEYSAFA